MNDLLVRLRKKLRAAATGGLAALPWNGAMLLLLAVAGRLLSRSGWLLPLFVRVNGTQALAWVGVGSDATVFREVFADGEYDVGLPEQAERIIDLGANVGYSTLWFALRYPNARIWAYEPDSKNLRHLRRNVGRYGRITVCSEAVAGTPGFRRLSVSQGKGMSSSLFNRSGLAEAERVTTILFDEILTRAGGGADIVKFDIEGAELESFSASRNLGDIRAFVGEVHPDIFGAPPDALERCFNGFRLSRTGNRGPRYILFALRQ